MTKTFTQPTASATDTSARPAYVKPELIILDGDEGDGKAQSSIELPNGAIVNGAFVDAGPS